MNPTLLIAATDRAMLVREAERAESCSQRFKQVIARHTDAGVLTLQGTAGEPQMGRLLVVLTLAADDRTAVLVAEGEDVLVAVRVNVGVSVGVQVLVIIMKPTQFE